MTACFNLIGSGRLGKSLAFALHAHKIAHLQGVYNRQAHHSEAAIQQLGSGYVATSLEKLSPVKFTFITVPDNQIEITAQALAATKVLSAGSIVMHCSGAFNSDLLCSLQAQGITIASAHPFKAFGFSSLQADIFKDCDWVMEGDELALQQISSLLRPLGGFLHRLNHKEDKLRYHTAAVLASNYLITLATESHKLLQEVGFESSLAKSMLERLLQSSLNNLKQSDTPTQALTGPISRGDFHTVKKHLQALDNLATKRLYCAAGLVTLANLHPTTSDQALIRQLLLAHLS